MKRALAVIAAVVFSACAAEKAPRVVRAGHSAACRADTLTLRTAEETSFAATNNYTERTTPLHKVTTSGSDYTITVADPRCGTVGHAVGQTPSDY